MKCKKCKKKIGFFQWLLVDRLCKTCHKKLGPEAEKIRRIETIERKKQQEQAKPPSIVSIIIILAIILGVGLLVLMPLFTSQAEPYEIGAKFGRVAFLITIAIAGYFAGKHIFKKKKK